MNLFSRFLFTTLLAILLAIFVGVAVDSVYPGPKEPEAPIVLTIPKTDGVQMTEEERQAQLDFDRAQKEYMEAEKVYSGRLSLVVLVCGAIILILSTTLFKGKDILMDVFLFGGVSTIFYAAIRGFVSEPKWIRLIVLAVGIVVSYWAGKVRMATKLPIDERK